MINRNQTSLEGIVAGMAGFSIASQFHDQIYYGIESRLNSLVHPYFSNTIATLGYGAAVFAATGALYYLGSRNIFTGAARRIVGAVDNVTTGAYNRARGNPAGTFARGVIRFGTIAVLTAAAVIGIALAANSCQIPAQPATPTPTAIPTYTPPTATSTQSPTSTPPPIPVYKIPISDAEKNFLERFLLAKTPDYDPIDSRSSPGISEAAYSEAYKKSLTNMVNVIYNRRMNSTFFNNTNYLDAIEGLGISDPTMYPLLHSGNQPNTSPIVQEDITRYGVIKEWEALHPSVRDQKRTNMREKVHIIHEAVDAFFKQETEMMNPNVLFYQPAISSTGIEGRCWGPFKTQLESNDPTEIAKSERMAYFRAAPC